MSRRLNKQRESMLSPSRYKYVKDKLTEIGIEIIEEQYPTMLKFKYNGCVCSIYPYSGWHTGKSIKDGRGIKKLLIQLI